MEAKRSEIGIAQNAATICLSRQRSNARRVPRDRYGRNIWLLGIYRPPHIHVSQCFVYAANHPTSWALNAPIHRENDGNWRLRIFLHYILYTVIIFSFYCAKFCTCKLNIVKKLHSVARC